MLDIDINLLLFSFISFIFLMIVLNKILYIPLLSFMDKRENSIKQDLSLSNNNESEIDALEKQAAEIIQEAKVQAAEIKAEAIKNAQAKLEEKVAIETNVLNDEYQKLVSQIQEEGATYKNELLSKVPLIQKSLNTKITNLS